MMLFYHLFAWFAWASVSISQSWLVSCELIADLNAFCSLTAGLCMAKGWLLSGWLNELGLIDVNKFISFISKASSSSFD